MYLNGISVEYEIYDYSFRNEINSAENRYFDFLLPFQNWQLKHCHERSIKQ